MSFVGYLVKDKAVFMSGILDLKKDMSLQDIIIVSYRIDKYTMFINTTIWAKPARLVKLSNITVIK